MGMKYELLAFDYLHKGYLAEKSTNSLLLAIFYFIKFSIKYDGVDIHTRN